MATAAVAALIGNLDKIFGFLGKYGPQKQTITAEYRQKLRQQLIDVVLLQVVKRLADSLPHKIQLDLRREEERQRVGQRHLPANQAAASADPFIHREVDVSTAEFLKRDDVQGRLLILGEPGAGKTNELLKVAKAMLQQALDADDAPLPIIFELSE